MSAQTPVNVSWASSAADCSLAHFSGEMPITESTRAQTKFARSTALPIRSAVTAQRAGSSCTPPHAEEAKIKATNSIFFMQYLWSCRPAKSPEDGEQGHSAY